MATREVEGLMLYPMEHSELESPLFLQQSTFSPTIDFSVIYCL